MKKLFISFVAILMLSQAGFAATSTAEAAANSTYNIWDRMRDAVIRDVQDGVNQTVNVSVSALKLASYKAELAQKKKELKRVEASSDNYFLKSYKKYRLNCEIRDLENKIKQLERELNY